MPDDVARRPDTAGQDASAGSVRESASAAVRRFVVWCPDWPVVAAATATGLAPLTPAAVFTGNHVLACSETARASGVRRGMRRREAQGRCPELAVCEHDPARDARVFEPVVAAVEALTPGVEVVRPGLVAVPARGPARYFGGEEAAAERIVDQVGAHTGVECQVGVADGLFAGVLAARRGVLVPPGGSREFLAPLDIGEIDQPAQQAVDRAELVDLLRRLGIRTLGEFAALVPEDVATRFGADALLAHRAARGAEERPPDRREPPPDLAVSEQLDPPVERVDAAAFAAKALAERLHVLLAERGLGCTRLGISARTEHGEQLLRVWRCAEPLTPAGTVDRVRWQLDGWLSGAPSEQRPTAGVSVLSLHPEEVVGAGGLQLDLMRSATGAADARAGRAFVRVQGMLGPDRVLVGVPSGGRNVRDQVTLVPWGDERCPERPPDRPWPGRIPAPSPSVVPAEPWPSVVLDATGAPVTVTTRLGLTAAPQRVQVRGRSRAVVGWAGPWPVRERWWEAGAPRSEPGSTASRDAPNQRSEPAEQEPAEHGSVGRVAAQESAGHGSAEQESAGQESAGQESAGQEPAGQESAGQEPAGQEPAGQESAGQGPVGRVAAQEAATRAAEHGAAEAPSGAEPARGAGPTLTTVARMQVVLAAEQDPGPADPSEPDPSAPDRSGSDSPDFSGSDFSGLDSPDPSAPDAEDTGEVALLLVHENGAWWVQGVYR